MEPDFMPLNLLALNDVFTNIKVAVVKESDQIINPDYYYPLELTFDRKYFNSIKRFIIAHPFGYFIRKSSEYVDRIILEGTPEYSIAKSHIENHRSGYSYDDHQILKGAPREPDWKYYIEYSRDILGIMQYIYKYEILEKILEIIIENSDDNSVYIGTYTMNSGYIAKLYIKWETSYNGEKKEIILPCHYGEKEISIRTSIKHFLDKSAKINILSKIKKIEDITQ